MSTKQMSECEFCARRVDNHYAAEGWIRVGGAVSRAHGVYDTKAGCYATDFIERVGGDLDFCSLACFVGALDKKRAERAARAAGAGT
jgi:hypothetical protein